MTSHRQWIASRWTSWMRAVLFAEPGSDEAELLHQTGYAQPALFALEVALYRLVES